MINRWLSFSKKVGNVQVVLVFKLFYFLIITPIGLIYRVFYNPLPAKKFPEWTRIGPEKDNIKKLKEQQ